MEGNSVHRRVLVGSRSGGNVPRKEKLMDRVTGKWKINGYANRRAVVHMTFDKQQ